MTIPAHIIANADDLGYNRSINEAILYCFDKGYINSTSLMVNTDVFGETVEMIHQKNNIHNIGVHIDLAEGRPVSNFNLAGYLDGNGNWDFKAVNQKFRFLSASEKTAFSGEIYGQIDKALSNKIPITHIDSHCHLHTLPGFCQLFKAAARRYNLKIRLAQTFNEGNYFKFFLRKYINSRFRQDQASYSERFETVGHFLKSHDHDEQAFTTEIMLHPYFDPAEQLKDHYDEHAMQDWITFLEKKTG